jgi:chromosome segregation ATPase
MKLAGKFVAEIATRSETVYPDSYETVMSRLKLLRERDDLEHRNEQLRGENLVLKRRLTEQTEEAARLKEQNDNLWSTIRQLTADRDHCADLCVSHNQRIGKLEGQVAALLDALVAAQEKAAA